MSTSKKNTKANRVQAVVVTYNRKEMLVECIEALLAQTFPLERLIILNNNSTDGTVDYLWERGYLDMPLIHLENMEKNLGGAGGFSEGMRIARDLGSDWIWIMDDDVIPEPDCLQALIDADARIEGKVSFLASAIRGTQGEVMNVPKLDRRQFNRYCDWYQYLDEGIVEIVKATFASLLICSDAVIQCGLPWAPFFIWGDDSEYTQRIIRDFGPAYMVGKSKAVHKRIGGEELSLVRETNQGRIPLYFYYYRNNLIGYWEYENALYKFLCMGRLGYDFFGVLFKGKYKRQKMGIILKAFFAFVLGTYDRESFRKRSET